MIIIYNLHLLTRHVEHLLQNEESIRLPDFILVMTPMLSVKIACIAPMLSVIRSCCLHWSLFYHHTWCSYDLVICMVINLFADWIICDYAIIVIWDLSHLDLSCNTHWMNSMITIQYPMQIADLETFLWNVGSPICHELIQNRWDCDGWLYRGWLCAPLCGSRVVL